MGANTARFAGGSELRVRFSELAYEFREDNRTADDVKDSIRKKLQALGGEDA